MEQLDDLRGLPGVAAAADRARQRCRKLLRIASNRAVAAYDDRVYAGRIPVFLWALIGAAGFGGGLAAAAGPSAGAAASCGAAAQRPVAVAVRAAQARYGLEHYGAAVHVALRRVAGDRALTGALRSGNLAAARTEAVRQVLGHQHVTAIRVIRGTRVLLETSVYPFDVAGAQTPLRDRRGVRVGSLAVSIQDVVGFIRLVHKYTASQVVVRGAGGEAKTSLAPALAVHLPAAGCATVAGRTYAVRSFGETSFTGEALTIWILKAT